MAPVFLREGICGTFNNVSIYLRNNSCSDETRQYKEEDRHALLYIVCTLLFYSLGIMIGIVSYIKREKRDIEQDRMFDDFLNSFKDKTEAQHYRKLKAQETIERLAEIDKKNMKADCIRTEKQANNTKHSKEEKQAKTFLSLSVKQPPVTMSNRLSAKIRSSDSYKSSNQAFSGKIDDPECLEPEGVIASNN